MKFHIEDIVANAKKGVPRLGVTRTNQKWVSQVIDYPDDWFMELTGYQPRIGKKAGYTALSKAGFKAFEPDLHAAFIASGGNAQWQVIVTWPDYVQAIDDEYAEIEKQRKRMIAKHQKIIDALNAFKL